MQPNENDNQADKSYSEGDIVRFGHHYHLRSGVALKRSLAPVEPTHYSLNATPLPAQRRQSFAEAHPSRNHKQAEHDADNDDALCGGHPSRLYRCLRNQGQERQWNYRHGHNTR
jgi:hypothetical protein